MLPITKVISLLDELTETHNYAELVKRIQIPLSEFNDYLFWDDNYYTRNCIVRNDDYELILLCWEPGQSTPIHCHNDQECWVYMVSGNIMEYQFQLNEQNIPIEASVQKIEKFSSNHINDAIGFHRLHNESKERCVSLHLYAKPIDECSYYSEESKSLKTKTLSYSNLKKTV